MRVKFEPSVVMKMNLNVAIFNSIFEDIVGIGIWLGSVTS